jgi:hypothetical protein
MQIAEWEGSRALVRNFSQSRESFTLPDSVCRFL